MKKKVLLYILLVSLLWSGVVFAEDTLYQNLAIGVDAVDLAPYSHSWEVVPEQSACLVFTFEGFPSKVIVDSGWFFGDDAWGEYNGQPFDLYYYSDPAELAYQIVGFEFDNPETLVICTKSYEAGGVEIGLRLKVIPEEIYKYKIFLPVIFTSTPTIYKDREITKDFETIQIGFPEAIPNQRTCVNYTWVVGTESLYIESGWFIGDLSSFSITLNGSSVSYTATQSGIAYNFEVKKTFSNPQGPLEICISRASGGGNEIGFRGGVQ